MSRGAKTTVVQVKTYCGLKHFKRLKVRGNWQYDPGGDFYDELGNAIRKNFLKISQNLVLERGVPKIGEVGGGGCSTFGKRSRKIFLIAYQLEGLTY